MKLSRKAGAGLVLLFLFGCFVFWFVTAPAMMAVQRIAAGNGPINAITIHVAGCYEAPLYPLCKFRPARRMADALGDWWWDILDPPETTP